MDGPGPSEMRRYELRILLLLVVLGVVVALAAFGEIGRPIVYLLVGPLVLRALATYHKLQRAVVVLHPADRIRHYARWLCYLVPAQCAALSLAVFLGSRVRALGIIFVVIWLFVLVPPTLVIAIDLTGTIAARDRARDGRIWRSATRFLLTALGMGAVFEVAVAPTLPDRIFEFAWVLEPLLFQLTIVLFVDLARALIDWYAGVVERSVGMYLLLAGLAGLGLTLYGLVKIPKPGGAWLSGPLIFAPVLIMAGWALLRRPRPTHHPSKKTDQDVPLWAAQHVYEGDHAPKMDSPGAAVTATFSAEPANGGPPPDPKKVPTALRLGDFYREEGKYQEAIEAYQDGLATDPSNAKLRARIDLLRSR